MSVFSVPSFWEDEPLAVKVERAATTIATAIAEHSPVAVYALVSGGNDSTVMSHLARYSGHRLDAIVHINTGIGIEETREFVRNTWAPYLDLPLIEEHPPVPYDDIVLEHGFPGPAGHRFMYIRLKERALQRVRREAQTKRGDRVVFLTGVRRSESQRRMGSVQPIVRQSSIVWVAPIVDFTNDDMREYRSLHRLPVNEVTTHLHMSGECLCGSFAHEGELNEIAFFYPQTAARIRALQERAADAGVHCVWGARPPTRKQASLSPGMLCQDCQLRFEAMQ